MFVSLGRFAAEAETILPGCTVYLTGSASMGDYREGWSDIDLLILAADDLTADQAYALADLRQILQEREPGNLYYNRIEGGAVSVGGYLTGAVCYAVYWGTTGQRVRDGYTADVFAQAAMERWILLRGPDVRNELEKPTPGMLYDGVKKHWETVRDHGVATKNPLYRCGWMLDISRCLYTLKTGRVTSKTAAGETALRMGWCPDEDVLRDALAVRYDPIHTRREIPDDAILRFNGVLEEALSHPMVTEPCFCGHDCGRCLVRCGDSRALDFYRDEMGISLNPEDLHCGGGRSESVMKLCRDCPMRKCCRERGLDFCIDCESPCSTYLNYVKKYVNKAGQCDETAD
ncbi:MAG: DUF3795 domain-containing protein [Clostridia bacterium]|nr:DUF3795 domain-containing protein [Clostridia bacterium]